VSALCHKRTLLDSNPASSRSPPVAAGFRAHGLFVLGTKPDQETTKTPEEGPGFLFNVGGDRLRGAGCSRSSR